MDYESLPFIDVLLSRPPAAKRTQRPSIGLMERLLCPAVSLRCDLSSRPLRINLVASTSLRLICPAILHSDDADEGTVLEPEMILMLMLMLLLLLMLMLLWLVTVLLCATQPLLGAVFWIHLSA